MTPISAAPRGKRYKLRIARVGCENVVLLQNKGVSSRSPVCAPHALESASLALVFAGRAEAGSCPQGRRLLPTASGSRSSRSPRRAVGDLSLGPKPARYERAPDLGSVVLAEGEDGVVAAEAEAVAQGDVEVMAACDVGDVVEVAFSPSPHVRSNHPHHRDPHSRRAVFAHEAPRR